MNNHFPETAHSSLSSLVGGIVTDAQVLVKQELALAKSEVANELHKAKDAAISLGLGIGVAALGCILLVLMVVHLLAWAFPQLPLWGCYGIVGAVLAVAGSVLLMAAKNRASAIHVMPEQTIASMKDNVQWIKNRT
jgi:hypothetical protein